MKPYPQKDLLKSNDMSYLSRCLIEKKEYIETRDTLEKSIKFIKEYYNTGRLNVIVDFWGPALKGQASEFCSMLDPVHKQNCYSGLVGRLHGVFKSPADRKAICDGFEKEFQTLCAS